MRQTIKSKDEEETASNININVQLFIKSGRIPGAGLNTRNFLLINWLAHDMQR